MEGDSTRQDCRSLNEKLNNVSIEQSECTIYKVHRHLRDVNPKAYEPQIIAIGPYHHGKDDLKMMEDHKLSYLRLLLQHRNENVEKFMSAIRPLESRARKSYAEPISLETTKFIEMLVLDGCFIIELVRKYKILMDGGEIINDPIFNMDWILNSLQRDLMLFENQIPFFVLCELFDLIEAPHQRGRLTNLLLCFFKSMYPGKKYKDVLSNDIKHLLDLIHRTLSPPPSSNSSEEDSSEKDSSEEKPPLIKNATMLEKANVKFKKDEKANLFQLNFEQGTIFMAPLTIEDHTESLFRNLIAYEQFFPEPHYMLDYVMFLDCLINSSKDIEILCQNGIVNNLLGDEEVVAKMVNKLGDFMVHPIRLNYTQIFKSVNDHCDKPWNEWMAKLRRNYLNSPWAIISVIAATVLLLLTVAQTLFTILQA